MMTFLLFLGVVIFLRKEVGGGAMINQEVEEEDEGGRGGWEYRKEEGKNEKRGEGEDE